MLLEILDGSEHLDGLALGGGAGDVVESGIFERWFTRVGVDVRIRGRIHDRGKRSLNRGR